MDRARLRQIIKEELSRAMNETRPVPGVSAAHPTGRTDAGGFALGGGRGMPAAGRYSGPPAHGRDHRVGMGWMTDGSAQAAFDKHSLHQLETVGQPTVRGPLFTGPGEPAFGTYTLSISDSDTEAGYLHASVEMEEGYGAEGDGDTPWEAVSAAVDTAESLGSEDDIGEHFP